MRRRAFARTMILMIAGLTVSACGREPEQKQPALPLADAPTESPCADPGTATQLRTLLIDRARQLHPAAREEIERIGAAAGLQVSEPEPSGRDPALNLTVCRTRIVLDLPEGASDAFGGGRQLAAELRYAVQRTASGSLLVHQLDGAEPLAMRLAAVSLRTPPAPIAVAAPTLSPAPAPRDRVVARPPARATALPPPLPASRDLPEPALASVGRPSFDCRRAGSRVERMICRDERLAALDRVAMSLYSRRTERAGRTTRALLQQVRSEFIERRDDCRRASCVADRYRDLMDEIDLIAGR